MANDSELMDFVITKGLWEGLVKRKDVCERFGISESKATKLFHEIRKRYPSFLKYTPEVKGYSGSHDEKSLKEFSFKKYLKYHSSPEFIVCVSDSVVAPEGFVRNQSISHLDYRKIHSSIAEGVAIKFGYRSLNSPEKEETRVVFPHAIIKSGYRWHIRGYEQSSGQFKDFNIPRMFDIELFRTKSPSEAAVTSDCDWNEHLEVSLVPNPTLPLEKQRIIKLDYGIQGEELTISCRKALYLYTMRSLEVIDLTDEPNEHQHLAISKVTENHSSQ